MKSQIKADVVFDNKQYTAIDIEFDLKSDDLDYIKSSILDSIQEDIPQDTLVSSIENIEVQYLFEDK